jgi:hypothetical protein
MVVEGLKVCSVSERRKSRAACRMLRLVAQALEVDACGS